MKMPQCVVSFIVMMMSMMPVLLSCTRATEQHVDGVGWGTTFHVTYMGDKDLTDSVHAVIAAVDNSLSTFNEASLVSRLNADTAVVADAYLRDVFKLSQSLNDITGHVFEPTLGPVIDLWGFGPGKNKDGVKDGCEVDSVMAMVGIDRCVMSNDTIYKYHPGTQFNFGAIAKGYGVDLIAAMLARNGVKDYLVEVGGELAIAGASPSQREWTVMIDAPVDGSVAGHQGLCTVAVTDCCMATSGNYRNYYYDEAGRRISHTIDPRTGFPVATSTLSATVVAGDCATADALATASMVMTPREVAVMFAGLDGCEFMLVVDDTDAPQQQQGEQSAQASSYIIYVSKGFPTMEINDNIQYKIEVL